MSNHRLRAASLSAVAAVVGVLLTSCAGSTPSTTDPAASRRQSATVTTATTPPAATPAPKRERDRRVYVAIGASETVGVGADDPRHHAWPTLLHRNALPSSSYVNVGVSGSTLGEALSAQLPRALAAEPDVVTVWLAVNDITHLVPVEMYEAQLRMLVHQLRRGGRTTVLVGNVPPVNELPAYVACLPERAAADVPCRLPVVPPEAVVVKAVDAYNAAIDRVARAEGAEVVDLSVDRLAGLTSGDGFHPSTAGHRLIARTFARALET